MLYLIKKWCLAIQLHYLLVFWNLKYTIHACKDLKQAFSFIYFKDDFNNKKTTLKLHMLWIINT